jgi:hypothetical protein
MDGDANSRLKKIEDRLRARGVRDIKFCWAPGVHKVPLEELKANVADFIEAYLEGKSTPIPNDEITEFLGEDKMREAHAKSQLERLGG